MLYTIEERLGCFRFKTSTQHQWSKDHRMVLNYPKTFQHFLPFDCSNNQSTPKDGHLDVSNALNGPWLKMKDFTCLTSGKTKKKISDEYWHFVEDKKNDFFFPPFNTRFIRVCFSNNYGGDDIRVQGIAFFGVDTRLINLLKDFKLENSLKTLLANVSQSLH